MRAGVYWGSFFFCFVRECLKSQKLPKPIKKHKNHPDMRCTSCERNYFGTFARNLLVICMKYMSNCHVYYQNINILTG